MSSFIYGSYTSNVISQMDEGCLALNMLKKLYLRAIVSNLLYRYVLTIIEPA